MHKTVWTLTSISVETQTKTTLNNNEGGKDLLPSSSWSQAEMMLCADGAPDRPLYSGQLPFDDP